MHSYNLIGLSKSLCFSILILWINLCHAPLFGQKKISVQADAFIVGKPDLPQTNTISTDTVFFFDKSKYALRGGRVISEKVWESDSIGLGSVAFGENTVARGDYSFAAGKGSKASSLYALAIGASNESTGYSSVSLGFDNYAKGAYSNAIGIRNSALADYSTAFGIETTASGEGSTSMGGATSATGDFSTALGFFTISESYGSLSMGRYNIGGGNTGSWTLSDPLLEIGNGESDAIRRNALTILKDGTFISNYYKLPEVDVQLSETMMFFDPSTGSFRSGTLFNSDAWDDLGAYSFATGVNTIATGSSSAAFGVGTIASGIGSTTFGTATLASNNYTMAMGLSSEASGRYSFAAGRHTKADSYGSFSIGQYNVGGGDADVYNSDESVFEIGNGQSNTLRSNALTVIKDGTFIVNHHTLPNSSEDLSKNILFFDPDKGALRAGGLISSKKWSVDSIGSNSFSFGQNSLSLGDNSISFGISSEARGINSISLGSYSVAKGIGSFSIGSNNSSIDRGSFSIGSGNSSIGFFSFSIGNNNNASGDNSFAIGSGNDSSGEDSFAAGYFTTASGSNATSFGKNSESIGSISFSVGNRTIAEGITSFASGNQTNATGDYSFSQGNFSRSIGNTSMAAGHFSKADSYCSVAIGRFNRGGGSADEWVENDPLFEIGNGTADLNRNNAITVYKNGQTSIGVNNSIGNTRLTLNSIPGENALNIKVAGYTKLGVNSNGSIGLGGGAGLSPNDVFVHNNLGIGAVLPEARLDVRGTSQIKMNSGTDPQLALHETSTSDFARLDFKNDNPETKWTIAAKPESDIVSSLFNIYLDGVGNVVRINGNKQMGIGRSPTHPLHIGNDASTGNGAHVTAGGTWTNGSSRTFKDNIQPINVHEILETLMKVEIQKWNYKGTDEGQHMGPMAEDFYKAFGLGNDAKYISTVDVDGVALAAIQALYKENQELKERLDKLEQLILEEND